jgi:DNA helicase-2/ATP-dependent DNA helicase PcrA
MYVAITRARQRLYLSFSQTRMLHGQTRYNLRSRFFDELPEAALKWITPKRAGFGSGFNAASGSGSNFASHSGARYGSGGAGGGYGGNRGFARDFTPAMGSSASPESLPVPPQRNAGASGPNSWVKAGSKVFHNKFGEGAVVSLEGTGDDARAQVKFGRHGVKWLALSVAKLTPI